MWIVARLSFIVNVDFLLRHPMYRISALFSGSPYEILSKACHRGGAAGLGIQTLNLSSRGQIGKVRGRGGSDLEGPGGE
jgi:hypothetical protein